MRLFTLLLLAPLFSLGQSKMTEDTLVLDNGLVFVKGQDLKFGSGSNSANKQFNFIYTNPASFAGKVNLGASYANMQMKIHSFKKFSSKRTGDKVVIMLSGGNLVKYMCEIEPALDSKEVIVKGYSVDKAEKTTTAADELKKWKDLFDSGAITKEEYETQKKKILGNE